MFLNFILIIAYANVAYCEKFVLPKIVPKIDMLISGLGTYATAIGNDLQRTPKFLNTTSKCDNKTIS